MATTSASICTRLGYLNGLSTFSCRYRSADLVQERLELGVVGVVDEAEGPPAAPVEVAPVGRPLGEGVGRLAAGSRDAPGRCTGRSARPAAIGVELAQEQRAALVLVGLADRRGPGGRRGRGGSHGWSRGASARSPSPASRWRRRSRPRW